MIQSQSHRIPYDSYTLPYIYIYTHSSQNWQNPAVQCIQKPRRCWDWAGKWLLQHGCSMGHGWAIYHGWQNWWHGFFFTKKNTKNRAWTNVWTFWEWHLSSMENRFMGVSINDGTPKWMVCNEKSFWNGWFGGTPILGNLQMMFAEARNARLLLALGKVKAEGGREVTQLVIVPSCVCYGQVNQQHNKLHELHGLLS